jgi:hypothetical protein
MDQSIKGVKLSGGSEHARKVASRLAHHPDWRTLGFFALTKVRSVERQKTFGRRTSCRPENEIIL